MEKSIQVFLSYAREDFEDAQKLYYRLEDAGIKPWMDKKNLFAGEKWEFAIRKAIRQSDLFLACLSKSSVQKRGFVQKEIRQAYDIWQEKLDSDIYLIPVRFEECDAPEKLSESNWVDLFEENGFDKLISAINEGANRQNILSVSQKAVKVGLSVQDKTFSESREQQPSYDIEISYPQFEGSGFTNLEELNTRILGEILEIVQQHRTIIFDEEKSSFLKDNDDTGGSSLDGGFEITILNPHLVSLMYDFSSYTYPAAHPNNWRQTANFYLNPVATIEIEQIFDYESNYLEILEKYCDLELRNQSDNAFELNSFLFKMEDEEINSDDFKNFNIAENGIIFSFSGPHVLGIQQVLVPYDIIKPTFLKSSPIYKLFTK